MRIALGCDHRGLKLKRAIMAFLKEAGHSYEDFGCYDEASVDYPDFASRVARGVVAGGRAKRGQGEKGQGEKGQGEKGILVCNTGIGMCMAANKVKGIRAALCHDEFTARRARAHNDANILCLGGGVLGEDEALEIVRAFLATEFEGGRHQRRLDKIRDMEGSPDFP